MTDQLKELRALVDYALECGITVGEARIRKMEFHRKVGPETVQALLSGLDAARAEGRRSPGGDHIAEAGKMVSPPSGEARAYLIEWTGEDGSSRTRVQLGDTCEAWLTGLSPRITALAPVRDEPAMPEAARWTDEQVEKAARAHDEEDAAQKGEPSPWTHFNCSTGAEFAWDCPDCIAFRAERLAAMRKGLEALAPPPPPVAELPGDVVELVIAAREAQPFVLAAFHDEVKAAARLCKALEPFSARVPYENEPASRAPTDTGEGR